jgi:hypothetical protein
VRGEGVMRGDEGAESCPAAVFQQLCAAMTHFRRGVAVVSVLALSACHLIDQRDFDSRAGRPPVLAKAPAGPSLGPQALLRIVYDNPDPEYALALASAVKRALTLKPGVLFTVQTLVPLAATPDAQAASLAAAAATGREIAEAIETDGADQGQIELAVKADPAVKIKEVRIYVH